MTPRLPMQRNAVSPRHLMQTIAVLAALCGSASSVRADEPPAPGSRTLTIEEAIDISKRCVLDEKVHLAGSFIESARFERNPRGDRGPYWLITWAWSREVKGGQVFVTVFQSRTCEITYGR